MKLRIAGAVLVAVGVVLGTAGCNFLVPQTTLVKYDASDGTSTTVGQVEVDNAMLISEDGKTANLVVTLVNDDNKSHRVLIQDSDSAKTSFHVTVPPNTAMDVGTPESKAVVIFKDTTTPPGSLHEMFFQYGDQTGSSLLIPVLDGTLTQYQDLTPKTIEAKSQQYIVTG